MTNNETNKTTNETGTQELHTIKSINTVAYLHSKGIYELYHAVEDTIQGKQLIFYFKKNDELFNVIREFKKDTNIQTILAEQRELKRMMYALLNR